MYKADVAERITPIIVEASTPKPSDSKQKIGQY